MQQSNRKESKGMLVLDSTQLRGITMDDEPLMLKVVGLLVARAAEQIEEIGKAVEHHDTDSCRRLAHSLAGSCGNVGAVSLATTVKAMEIYAACGDLSRCRRAVGRLRTELDRLRDAASELAVTTSEEPCPAR